MSIYLYPLVSLSISVVILRIMQDFILRNVERSGGQCDSLIDNRIFIHRNALAIPKESPAGLLEFLCKESENYTIEENKLSRDRT